MIPPRSILIAVDFSEPSRVALGFAARLARHTGATLHVVHAEDPLLSAAASHSGIDLARETREELQRFVEPSLPSAALPAVRYHVVSGQGTSSICHAATRERADVIVMGMHGMSGPTRAVFGSTTAGVLRQAPTSVLAVPDAWRAPRGDTTDLTGMGPVVAAVESGQPSMEGAAAACALAALLDTTLDLVHIVPEISVLSRWRAHAETALTERIAAARTELTLLASTLGDRVPVRLRVESGTVAAGIAAAVDAGGGRSPLLVLGRRGQRNQLGPPGATAYRVLALAQVPVLVYVPEA